MPRRGASVDERRRRPGSGHPGIAVDGATFHDGAEPQVWERSLGRFPFVVGRYNVLAPLGAGGMAEALLAETPAPARLVTLKRIRAGLDVEPEVVRMFLDEARLLRALDHPNIVRVLEVQETPDGPCMVLEFVDGADLGRLCSALRTSSRQMPVPVALYIALSLARGLHHAHRAVGERGEPLRLVHRDVTPANILVGRRGGVKLTDFGVARATGRVSRTLRGELKGTFNYLAPETIESGKCDARSDVFGACAVLWECLCNRRLFDGKTDYQVLMAVTTQPVEAPSRHHPQVTAAVDAVVLKGLERDPARRFNNANELELALAQLLRGIPLDGLARQLGTLLVHLVRVPSDAEVAALPRPGVPPVDADAGEPTLFTAAGDDDGFPTEKVPVSAPADDGWSDPTLRESRVPTGVQQALRAAATRTDPDLPGYSASSAAAFFFKSSPSELDRVVDATELCTLLAHARSSAVAGILHGRSYVATQLAPLLLLDAHDEETQAGRATLRGRLDRPGVRTLFSSLESRKETGALHARHAGERRAGTVFVVDGKVHYVRMADARAAFLSELGGIGVDVALLLRAVMEENSGIFAAARRVAPEYTPRLAQLLDSVCTRRLQSLAGWMGADYVFHPGQRARFELPPARRGVLQMLGTTV